MKNWNGYRTCKTIKFAIKTTSPILEDSSHTRFTGRSNITAADLIRRFEGKLPRPSGRTRSTDRRVRPMRPYDAMDGAERAGPPPSVYRFYAAIVGRGARYGRGCADGEAVRPDRSPRFINL